MSMSNLEALFKGLQTFNDGVTSLATNLATQKANKQIEALNAQVQAETDSMIQSSAGTAPPEEISKFMAQKQREQATVRGQIAGNLAMNLTGLGADASKIQTATQAIAQTPQQTQGSFETERQFNEGVRRFDASMASEQARTQALAQQSLTKAEAKQPPSVFDKKRTEEFAKQVDKSTKATEGLGTIISNAKQVFQDYIASGGSTGKGTDLFGLRTAFSTDRQKVDREFNRISLDTLVKTFAGFAKSIDTDAERAFFNATQLSVSENLPETNAQIMAGMEATIERDRIENAAKIAYVEENGKLDSGYKSPLDGKTPAFNALTGQVEFVDKANKEAIANSADGKNPLISLDAYSKVMAKGKLNDFVKTSRDMQTASATDPYEKLMLQIQSSGKALTEKQKQLLMQKRQQIRGQ